MKVLKELGDNQYIVEIKPDEKVQARETSVALVHDYVAFGAYDWLSKADNSISSICHWVDIHIPIRSFIQVMMPLFAASDYTKAEHIKDREYSDDDKYNGDQPRYKKGDKYAGYSDGNEVVHYWDRESHVKMVAVKLRGERKFSHMTLELFNQFVRDNIKYR